MANKVKKASARDDAQRKSFMVAPGHTVTTRESVDGKMSDVIYEPGDEIELHPDEAKKMKSAIIFEDRRKGSRPGQVSRLKSQIEELQKQLAEAKSAPKHPEDDPEYDKMIESIENRGDNFEARGEPAVGKVPQELIDRHEREAIAADFGGEVVPARTGVRPGIGSVSAASTVKSNDPKSADQK